MAYLSRRCFDDVALADIKDDGLAHHDAVERDVAHRCAIGMEVPRRIDVPCRYEC
jgi:hypothetical protein